MGHGQNQGWMARGAWRLALGALLLAGAGCVEDGSGEGTGGFDVPAPPEPTFVSQDAGACAEPEEGCACEPGSEPVSCYLDPVSLPGGGLACREGTRYCRDGAWSGCEDVRSFVLSGVGSGYSIGPRTCNPCDPACAYNVDRPTPGDLTPGNSSGVTYDGSRGGLTLRDTGTAMGGLPDRDGDGVPDVADDFPDDPRRWNSSGGGIYHTLPFGGPVRISPLDFTTRVTTADVYLLMDTTGSMGGEIRNLQASLTRGSFVPRCGGGVIGAIKCMIPNAWIGLGRHDDYPVRNFGSGADRPYVHMVDLTPSPGPTQVAVNALRAAGGWDWPESQTQALWAMATGNGLGQFLGARRGCPRGRWGYPCFRPDTIPIVILFTDADFHNGPRNVNPYPTFGGGCCGGWVCTRRWWWGGCRTRRCRRWCTGFRPPRWEEVIAELNARNVKLIIVDSSGGWGGGRAHYRAILNATGSVDAAGRPYMISISPSGAGLSRAVVDAVWNLANNTRFDVTARAVDNPTTPLDERRFVKAIRVRGWGPGNCRGASGARAIQCTPGTVVDFQVDFRNDFVRPTAVPQVFEFEIQVLLDGTVQQRVPVRIVVPPERPVFPPTGYYQRVYDGSAFCSIPPQNVRWGLLRWSGSTPGSTALRFEIKTADTAAGLGAGGPDVVVDVPPAADVNTVGFDVGAALRAAGVPDQRPFLRIRAVLVASPDRSQSPVLRYFSLRYDCIAGT